MRCARPPATCAQFGGLTAFLYSIDEDFIAQAEAAYAAAGAQLTINLTGPMPLNFAAAYSDYHVTGLNPAGNASLTDLAFVAGRFRITQSQAAGAGAESLKETDDGSQRDPGPARRLRADRAGASRST